MSSCSNYCSKWFMMVYIEVPKVVLYGFIFIFLRINPKFSECVYILDLFITQLEIDFLYLKFEPLCIQISKHKNRHKQSILNILWT